MSKIVSSIIPTERRYGKTKPVRSKLVLDEKKGTVAHE